MVGSRVPTIEDIQAVTPLDVEPDGGMGIIVWHRVCVNRPARLLLVPARSNPKDELLWLDWYSDYACWWR